MSMTYDLLVQDISGYAERSDEPFLTQIPRFISLAESRISMEDKPLGHLRIAEGTLNSSILKKPARWRRTRNFNITVVGERKFLLLRSYEYCRSFNPTSATGEPRYYADYDYEHFFIAPVPVTTYNFELAYYERPEPLSSSKQTSWLTQYAPQLLLYASLMEAMPFLKNSERIPEFQALYDRALQSLVKEDSERIVDASS